MKRMQSTRTLTRTLELFQESRRSSRKVGICCQNLLISWYFDSIVCYWMDKNILDIPNAYSYLILKLNDSWLRSVMWELII